MTEDTKLLERAQAWRAADPDPTTQDELGALIEGGDTAALRARFAGPLRFGTAGLRGVIGAGESRMNRAVVIRTSVGLGRYLLDAVPEAKQRGVVIGFDGRRGSTEFAHDAAGVFAALGLNVYLAPRCVPTPLTAFAVTHLNACAGVMVTASHNPPEYNGYKVYAPNGAQIIPPMDAEIAAQIEAAEAANAVPRLSLEEGFDQDLVCEIGPAVFEAYLSGVADLIPQAGPGRGLTIAYTPLHGVGAELTEQVFSRCGFSALHTTPQQREPDGGFPTVTFPNPEEDGAMDLVLALAKEQDAALVLAQDPDAEATADAKDPDAEADPDAEPSADPAPDEPKPEAPADDELATAPIKGETDTGVVARVVDGDTFHLEDGRKVRLIGINTPEKKSNDPLNREATALLKELVDGKTVTLEFDAERTDQFKRTLAHVFVGDVYVNGEIVRQGLAYCYTWKPNTAHTDDLAPFQLDARDKGRGLWGLEPPEPADHYEASRSAHRFHRPGCKKGPRSNSKRTFNTRNEAFDAGLNPCSDCKP